MDELTRPDLLDNEELRFDNVLRPSKLQEYFGQDKVKKNIEIVIKAAQIRQEPIDHVLLYGPPGLGKTTLAKIIGSELNVNVKITSGPAIERPGDLASILTNLESGDILFIDEIHRLNRVVEETLYPAMEDRALDLVLGRGPSARTLRLDLPPFSVIGATTRIGLMSGAIRDRFGSIYRLEYYTPEELEAIIQRSADMLNVEIEPIGVQELALRSRGTPRIANRLLKRVRDYAAVQGNDIVTKQVVLDACNLLGVDNDGLDVLDHKYIECLVRSFNGGPAGIETIAASISEDVGTLTDVVEPFLMQKGFIKRTIRGRQATEKGFIKLGIEYQAVIEK